MTLQDTGRVAALQLCEFFSATFHYFSMNNDYLFAHIKRSNLFSITKKIKPNQPLFNNNNSNNKKKKRVIAAKLFNDFVKRFNYSNLKANK